jgi:hypothetical protein
VNALAAYAHARVSLDQTLGETLERNHVSLDEGLSGRVAWESKAPEVAVGGEGIGKFEPSTLHLLP